MLFYISSTYPLPPRRDGTSLGVQEATEDYEQLVMEACNVLADTDCEFHGEGFGNGDWPLDIGYDLSAFMEQFPELLAGVRGQRYVEVDLYPQGLERTLEFHPDGDLVRIRCISRTDWMPDPDVEFMTRKELDEMLVELAFGFAEALAHSDSPISRMPPFAHWQAGRV